MRLVDLIQPSKPNPFDDRVAKQIREQRLVFLPSQIAFHEKAPRAAGNEVAPALRVSQQVELRADTVAFGVAFLRLEFNFPEHRALSWLEPAARPTAVRRWSPGCGGISPIGLPVVVAHPARRRGCG